MTEQSPEQVLEQPLTPEYAARLLFLSFKYSQGESDLQEAIFEYVRGLHPTWTVFPDRGEIWGSVWPMIQRFMKGGHHNPLETEHHEGEDTLNEELGSMQVVFERGPTQGRDGLVAEVTGKIVEREIKYIGGRPSATDQDRPFSSQLCVYGLLARDAGMTEYDEMFRDIATHARAVVTYERDTRFAQDILGIVEFHNAANPRAHVTL